MVEETNPIEQMTYEQARKELVETAQKLESRDIPLEDALKLWEHGQKLAQHCEGILNVARQRVQPQQPTE